jgi:hypothetical protein
MLSVSIDEFTDRKEDIAAELRAGHSLKLLQGGKRIGEIHPSPPEPSEEQREAAWKRMLAMMDSGLDLGGVPFTYEERHDR